MDHALLTIAAGATLLALLASGVWVAFALLGVGALTLAAFSTAPIGQVMATTIWGASSQWQLAALPLFVWMGELLFRSRLSEQLVAGLAPWLGRLPGGLLHVNVFGSALLLIRRASRFWYAVRSADDSQSAPASILRPSL
jgi:TRAP-type mannitol/chloroaromatic compound transport system permease large subunit